MSSEPPPRILPKGLSHETKSAQEDIASSRKVEKVRAVDATDADERARQRDKFRRMMGDEEDSVDESAPKAPSPFDVFSGATEKGNANASVFSSPAPSQSATPPTSYGDIDDAIVASPAYTPPPDLTAPPPSADDDEEEATMGALPQSEDFWDDVDLPPDRTLPTQQTMEESPKSAAKSFPGKKGAAETGKKEASPFGPPGKPVTEGKSSAGKKETKETAKLKSPEKKSLPSPFEEAASKAPSLSKKPTTEKEGVATTRYFAPEEMAQREAKKSPAKEKAKAANNLAAREPDMAPFRLAKEEQSGGASKDRGRKIVEIEAPSLSLLPASVQPGAFAATSAATPYLHPSTVSLFFQMVGTMYVMSAPPGISRTEIVLNNPAYAGSRFYGSTITIEKYATAPDSFNIRLTGNDTAVTAFRDNIPSLMEGFQTSNLPFRVHRIDAEYTIERPVFRRKERGEEKGETDSGDLGERRK